MSLGGRGKEAGGATVSLAPHSWEVLRLPDPEVFQLVQTHLRPPFLALSPQRRYSHLGYIKGKDQKPRRRGHRSCKEHTLNAPGL